MHLVKHNAINILLHIVLYSKGNKLMYTLSFISIALSHGSQSVAWEPLEIPKTHLGICEFKTFFIIILRCYLLFSLSFSHECTMEFFKSYIIFDHSDVNMSWIYYCYFLMNDRLHLSFF